MRVDGGPGDLNAAGCSKLAGCTGRKRAGCAGRVGVDFAAGKLDVSSNIRCHRGRIGREGPDRIRLWGTVGPY